MASITYSQVQDLVQQLPLESLPAAYSMLRELADREETSQAQLDFMRLPLAERREILAHQAEEMKAYYIESATEREVWLSGDFADEGSTG